MGRAGECFLPNSLLRMLELFIRCANNFKFSSLYNKSSAAKSPVLCWHVVASPPLQARYLSNYCMGEADLDLTSAASSPGACPCCRLSAFYFLLSTRPACKSSLPEQPALQAGLIFPLKVSKMFLQCVPQLEAALHFTVPPVAEKLMVFDIHTY